MTAPGHRASDSPQLDPMSTLEDFESDLDIWIPSATVDELSDLENRLDELAARLREELADRTIAAREEAEREELLIHAAVGGTA